MHGAMAVVEVEKVVFVLCNSSNSIINDYITEYI